jgi:hypothetical protein
MCGPWCHPKPFDLNCARSGVGRKVAQASLIMPQAFLRYARALIGT